MSDPTVRETPTEALEGDGLPNAVSKPADPPGGGSGGKSAGDPTPKDVGKLGSHDAGKSAARGAASAPKPRAAANVTRDQKTAGAKAGKPAPHPERPHVQAEDTKKPPVARTRAVAPPMREDHEGPLDAAHANVDPPKPGAAAATKSTAALADETHGPAVGADDDPPASSSDHDEADEEPTLDRSQQNAAQAKADAQEGPRPQVQIRLFGRTDVGQVREHNEDNFIVADLTKASRGLMDADRYQVVGERGALLGVCDGMGGAAAGEVASQLAVDIIYQRMSASGPPQNHDELAARLVQAIEAAGLRIFSEAKLDRTRRGMGTTSTIAALMDDHLFLGQVGDSRAYILRDDRLVQVTRDQSLVNQLIEAGQLTEEEAETFEHNNIILQALGTADTVQVDLTYVQLKKGDTLMLCSDGLSGMVRNEEIREVLRTVDDPLEACKVLTDRANQAGGHDNITVVVAKFDGEGLTAPTREEIEGLRYQKYQLPEHLLAASAVPEPSRRVEKFEEKKISQRPPAPRSWLTQAEIEGGEESDGYDDIDGGAPLNAGGVPSSGRPPPPDEQMIIPTDGAPQWLVIMMIASAVACVTIAGYYLLR